MLIAAIGASAHSGLSLAKLAGVQSAVSGDEASGTRTEAVDTPEATKTPEPTDTPEPASTEPADVDVDVQETGDHETETGNDTKTVAATTKATKHDGSDQKQSGDNKGD